MTTPNFIVAVDGNTGYAVNWTSITDALSGKSDSDIVAFLQIAPPGALSAVVGSSGNLTGAYQYKVAFVTGYWTNDSQTGTPQIKGNTGGGTASNTVNPAAQNVNLSNIPTGPTGVVQRIIYRTQANGSTFYYLTTINDNATTTYSDNTADSSLGAAMPTINTTGAITQLWKLDVTDVATFENIIGKVNGTPTQGNYGVGTIVASASDTEITSTSQTNVVSFTPSAQGNFLVYIYYRVVTDTTNVTINLTYDDGAGAQTITLVSGAIGTGSYSVGIVMVNATTSAPIEIQATAGTADQVYISAVIQAA